MSDYPVAATTNYHILSGLKQQIYHLTVLYTRSLKSGCGKNPISSERSRGEPFPCLFHLMVVSGIPWLVSTAVWSNYFLATFPPALFCVISLSVTIHMKHSHISLYNWQLLAFFSRYESRSSLVLIHTSLLHAHRVSVMLWCDMSWGDPQCK